MCVQYRFWHLNGSARALSVSGIPLQLVCTIVNSCPHFITLDQYSRTLLCSSTRPLDPGDGLLLKPPVVWRASPGYTGELEWNVNVQIVVICFKSNEKVTLKQLHVLVYNSKDDGKKYTNVLYLYVFG